MTSTPMMLHIFVQELFLCLLMRTTESNTQQRHLFVISFPQRTEVYTQSTTTGGVTCEWCVHAVNLDSLTIVFTDKMRRLR